MITCEGCGEEFEDDSEFCSCCGTCFECCAVTDHDCAGEDDGRICPCCNATEGEDEEIEEDEEVEEDE